MTSLLCVDNDARTNLKVGDTPGVVIFFVVPHHFLALHVQLVVLVSAFVLISTLQFGQFFVCCSSTHGASPFVQPFVKVWAPTPIPELVMGTFLLTQSNPKIAGIKSNS